MIIYPAIDIKNGKCVRLLQGRTEDSVVYGDEPSLMAKKWVEQGAEYLHVVDLDGAFTGEGKNFAAIERICAAAGNVPIQLGGGIRCMADIEKRLSFGVTRVILGTAAINDPAFTALAAREFEGRIVAGIDAKNGMVAVNGWVELTNTTPIELAKRLYDIGIRMCVYTDISRDGMLGGPNYDETRIISLATGMDVIASGGMSTIEDVQRLAAIRIHGVIIGKALYDGRIELSQAIRIGKGTK